MSGDSPPGSPHRHQPHSPLPPPRPPDTAASRNDPPAPSATPPSSPPPPPPSPLPPLNLPPTATSHLCASPDSPALLRAPRCGSAVQALFLLPPSPVGTLIPAPPSPFRTPAPTVPGALREPASAPPALAGGIPAGNIPPPPPPPPRPSPRPFVTFPSSLAPPPGVSFLDFTFENSSDEWAGDCAAVGANGGAGGAVAERRPKTAPVILLDSRHATIPRAYRRVRYRQPLTRHSDAADAIDSSIARGALAHSRSLTVVDADVKTLLKAVGFQQYVELFARKRIAGEMLASLSNAELRDDLGISNLRHRREILSAIARAEAAADRVGDAGGSLPECGRILVHLANVRNFHSWLRLGTQHTLFALALLRLAPLVRPTPAVLVSAVYTTAAGLAAHLYGYVTYRLVIRGVDADRGMEGHRFRADVAGVYVATACALATAAFILYIIVYDGFSNNLNSLPN